jgi:hypothetical protein
VLSSFSWAVRVPFWSVISPLPVLPPMFSSVVQI